MTLSAAIIFSLCVALIIVIALKMQKKKNTSNLPESTSSEESEMSEDEEETSSIPERDISAFRPAILEICEKAGYKPAQSLPWIKPIALQSDLTIASRLHALKILILWVMVPEENLPSSVLQKYIDDNDLRRFITPQENEYLRAGREVEASLNSIGWKFENVWPLAWYFGYKEPEITGEMMSGELFQEILTNYTSELTMTVKDWLKTQTTRSEDEVNQKEDLFYCLHNAARSAQIGKETVPAGFDPMSNGGVIHERRHAFTWMISKDVDWDETDLST